jgi:glucose uptake protein GlcU
VSDTFSIIFSNSMFFIVAILRIYGLQKFFNKKVNIVTNIIFGLTFFSLLFFLIYFTFISNSIYIRTIAIGICLSGLSIFTGILIIKNRSQKGYSSYIFAGIIFFLFSFIFYPGLYSGYCFRLLEMYLVLRL